MIQRLRQFERQKESGEELGMDESELKTGNKGETEAEEMGDENLEVTTSMVKQAAEKKKVSMWWEELNFKKLFTSSLMPSN